MSTAEETRRESRIAGSRLAHGFECNLPGNIWRIAPKHAIKLVLACGLCRSDGVPRVPGYHCPIASCRWPSGEHIFFQRALTRTFIVIAK